MNTDVHYGPGDVCPTSGLWAATSGEKADIALSRGDRFPPLEADGARWVLKEATAPGSDPELETVDEAERQAVLEQLERVSDGDPEIYPPEAPETARVGGYAQEPTPETSDPASVAASPGLADATRAVVDAARDLVLGGRAGATASAKWLALRQALRHYDQQLAETPPEPGQRHPG